MLKLWRLKWDRWRTQRFYTRKYRKLEKKKVSDDALGEVVSQEYWEVSQIENEIDCQIGRRLFDKARALDVETPPPKDEQMWIHSDDGRRIWFSPKGRAHVRKLIDEEKARRFEVRTLWVTKIVIPLASLLIGIIGAIIGLVAVLHKK